MKISEKLRQALIKAEAPWNEDEAEAALDARATALWEGIPAELFDAINRELDKLIAGKRDRAHLIYDAAEIAAEAELLERLRTTSYMDLRGAKVFE